MLKMILSAIVALSFSTFAFADDPTPADADTEMTEMADDQPAAPVTKKKAPAKKAKVAKKTKAKKTTTTEEEHSESH